jgi:hypothetical protein
VETEDTNMILGMMEVKATTAAEDSADYQGPTHHIWKDGLVYLYTEIFRCFQIV